MDWKLFFATFGAIFVAEIGDKTQLATLAFAGGGSSRWVVFVAASLALIASTAVAVLAGAALTRYVSPVWIQRGAGALFVVLGVIFLLSSARAAPPPEASPPPAAAETQPLPAE
jgi:Ca2+/H+ antiporter, TMEM165/GDT1 family